MAQITEAGLVIRSLSSYRQLLEDRIASEVLAATGEEMSRDRSTVQGALIRALAPVFHSLEEALEWRLNGFNPARMVGIQLDDYAILFGLTRIQGVATSVALSFTGVPGSIIPAGSRFQTANETVFVLQDATTLDADGEATGATALAEDVGAIAVEANQVTRAIDLVTGLDSVNNPNAGVPGRSTELDVDFRERINKVRTRNARGTVDSILSKVRDVVGVEDGIILENYTNAPVTLRGVTTDANSIHTLVLGGAVADVAEALYLATDPGMVLSGSTTHTYTPTVAPFGPVDIKFTPVTQIPIILEVSMRITDNFPSGGVETIKQNYFELISGFGIGVFPEEQQLFVPVLVVPGASVISVVIKNKATSAVLTGVDLNESVDLLFGDIVVTVTV